MIRGVCSTANTRERVSHSAVPGSTRLAHVWLRYALIEVSTHVGVFQNFMERGEMVFKHLISITESKFELQHHIALQRDILSESAFYKKR